ncbi:MAG: hypothetical protein E6J13_12355 [Chloroflexi bacterium]|nr:MAG: hypothetical protein E6J13_12355 [Chloroflexota bacterium]
MGRTATVLGAITLLMSTLLVAAPGSAATTILWTAQSSLGELFDTDADVALDLPRAFRQEWLWTAHLSDRTVSWPATIKVETQLPPSTLRAFPAVAPAVSGSTATYSWATSTGAFTGLSRAASPLTSSGFSLARDFEGGRTIAAGAVEPRHVVARFVATRLMRNYQLDVGFEPNWGLGVTPPVLPVTPSNVRCLPAPDGGTALRPRWSGGTIAAGTEVSVACDVTLANASASPTQYVPELSMSESPPEGTVALPTATTATHDDPILGRTTFSVNPPAGASFTGSATQFRFRFVILNLQNGGPVRKLAPLCAPSRTATPTQSVYLPNVTRRLGGPTGFYTPFIIQNTGTTPTELEVSFYKFSDGSCVQRSLVSNLRPGAAYSNDPNGDAKNPALPDDAQFSVVVRSFGSTVVGVVNEHQGVGDRAEALSYNGFTAGAKTVYLPNVTRRFFGLFVTPFVIQNLGTATASVTATFRPFDGGAEVTVRRTIDPGRAKPIDPNSDDPSLGAPGLADGKQYAVTVQSSEDVAVVVNTQADAPSVDHPLAFATDGAVVGGATIYGAYAAKNAQGVGRYSPIIVQNLGGTAVVPTITFTPLVGSPGAANAYTFPSIAPASSRSFDPRFSFSTQGVTNLPCGGGGADCLADGSTASTGMGYSATATPMAKSNLPNVTKSLCFCPSPTQSTGWTTPILLQSVTATTITLRWYSFAGGALAGTQTVSLTPGTGMRIDPWTLVQLAPDRQYSVVVDGGTGTLTAIVSEFASGGDNAMMYEGFASP